mmetsp:Transcript_23693/g.67042  ORF Transcript_23693/g.67042 Transcript_23693/m.67042 type:complete len:207 (+) Transcript_23693:185-805(+)
MSKLSDSGGFRSRGADTLGFAPALPLELCAAPSMSAETPEARRLAQASGVRSTVSSENSEWTTSRNVKMVPMLWNRSYDTPRIFAAWKRAWWLIRSKPGAAAMRLTRAHLIRASASSSGASAEPPACAAVVSLKWPVELSSRNCAVNCSGNNEAASSVSRASTSTTQQAKWLEGEAPTFGDTPRTMLTALFVLGLGGKSLSCMARS